MLSAPATLQLTGTIISPGFSSFSAPLQLTAPTFLLLNNSMWLLFSFPPNFLPNPLICLPLQHLSHCPNLLSTISPPPLLFLPPDLLQASHVLVHRDAAAPPLAPVYSGPYQVLSRSPHFFTLCLGSHTDTVSVHRLKAAVMTPSTPTVTPVPPPPRSYPPSSIL